MMEPTFGMRDITGFVPWLVGASTPELAIIKAVTGYTDLDLDGLTFPADGADFSRCVDLVEKHNLYNLLCRVAVLDLNWWRIVANWGRLTRLLDSSEPRWREGEPVTPVYVDAEITRLYDRPVVPRRILLDMDGPLADFDRQCWTWATSANAKFDIDDLGQQTHRRITKHLPDETHHQALRAVIDAPGWYRSLPVTPGAQEGVEALLSVGHDIVVCSKPHEDTPTCEPEKKAWLAEHFPMLRDRYIFTPDKSLAYAGASGILLDDDIVHEQVPYATWEPVVFSVPFNRPGTQWGRYPRWSWGDPIERLAW